MKPAILIGSPKMSINEGIKLLLNKISDWKDDPVWTLASIEKVAKAWFDLLGKK